MPFNVLETQRLEVPNLTNLKWPVPAWIAQMEVQALFSFPKASSVVHSLLFLKS